MKKAVIIGCGNRAAAHIEAYKHIEEAHVTACCAPSAERREPLAAKYRLRAYDNAEKMIRAEKPDMVHIITPPSVRVELMQLVSNLKVPLCTTEKPVAIGVRDWLALRKLESESDTRFGICHQFRWQEDLVKCQQGAGKIGELRFLDMSAGMNIANQGTHTLNYGRSLIRDARVVRVYGSAGEKDLGDTKHTSPFMSEAMLTFDNGVRGLWTSGSVSPRVGDPSTTWQHVRVTVYGSEGRVNYEEFGKWDIVSGSTGEHGDFGGMVKWREKNDLAQAGFHKAMFEWGEDEKRVPGTSLEASLHEWQAVLALYESTLTRRPVEMADFNPSPDLVERILGGPHQDKV